MGHTDHTSKPKRKDLARSIPETCRVIVPFLSDNGQGSASDTRDMRNIRKLHCRKRASYTSFVSRPQCHNVIRMEPEISSNSSLRNTYITFPKVTLTACNVMA